MKPETRSFYELAVQRAVRYLVVNLDEALDLERLAREAALSPFHFHRIFRGMVGETPLELHRRLRLERAAFCLIEKDTPVTTIAFEAGYDTHEAFTRAFTARYARPPSEFRQARERSGPSCHRFFQIEIAARSGIHFQAQRLDDAAFSFMKGETNMNVEIQKLDPLRTIAVRHIGPYNRISEAFGRLGEIVGPLNLFHERPMMLAIYHDDQETTPERELRSDAALVVGADVKVPAGLTEQLIPGGRYARTTFVGPYEQLGDAWARFMGQWLPQSGERLGNGVPFEVYKNTPAEVPKDELETDLYLPLA